MTSRQQMDSKCVICLSEVKELDNGVACDGCEKWHHNTCGEIDEDLYKTLTKFEGKKGQGLNWYCPTCNSSIKKVLHNMQGMLNKQKELEKEITQLKKLLDNTGYKRDIDEVKRTVEAIKREHETMKNDSCLAKKELEDTKKGIETEIKQTRLELKELEVVSKEVVEIKLENEGMKKLWTEVVLSKTAENEKNEPRRKEETQGRHHIKL